MCGIAGLFDITGHQAFDRGLLREMNQTQFHRGPDEGGDFLEPGIALAHRRLSIIDLSSGQQPMHSADGAVSLVYNGEIYNFGELAAELKGLGYQFRTRCDTEVILYAWQEWGEACVERFRGMFAFAIYDARRQCVFLARDRLGIKPLFYSLLHDGVVAFGSELKVLKAHPKLPRSLEPRAVEDYFALGYIPEPKTIYRGVYKLRPGHTLLLERGKSMPNQREYWDVPFEPVATGSEADLCEELFARMREAVDIRLVSEVPLGAFLSGGVDSSAVVAAMAQLQSDPVNTCAIGFDVPQFNETDFARQVADRYGTNHLERVVASDDFDLLDTLAALYDEPYADSSAIPTYRVCQLARERVTVALSGDGGDEHFAGYRRYRWHMNEERMRNLLPLGIRKPVFGTLGRLYPKLDWAPRVFRAKTTFESIGRTAVEAYLHSVSLTSDTQRNLMFSDAMQRELQGYRAVETFEHYARRCPADDPLSLIQYLDMKTYLVGDILTKVDRASMAHSLEVRVPLLDHKFIEWVSGLPVNMKLRGQEGKYILKKALEPHLPHDVLYRPKMGFGVPLGKWFRGPLKKRIRESLLEGNLAQSGMFCQSYLEQLVNDHQSGLREYSAPLWALMMFQASMADDDISLA
ncbi:XrtA/PEP-CTERM system amidotransferase [Candidatus Marimicrobium litorale]|uniref:asparagine synthase (glutamine-hydrolyzing) n=1 Tax=Candidatus Marimicrobium litorale TaxID=2518991 RepID=A0ABT3T0Y2_9GAMM|nr:XrtA/PEP-CTERM system amidotransferase [Candidatus Marimicrobium litorale]MCX2975909.1 amidotransferase 1, exosortase A system-associated [Candidatus Marimicrobium litorale]